jgi:serine/threonine protein kinase
MIGQTISNYRILKKLGEGGMGVVYLAEDMRLGRRVAIKLLTTAHNQNFRARFLREARAISSLSHPNVATLYDYGESEDGQPFIVMELVEGETLTELLLASALTIVRAVEIIERVADALGAAHEQGIIHRDIKPSNVVVNERGVVKVLDFGLAKRLNEGQSGETEDGGEASSFTETRSDVVVGTPLYLSPEQATSAPVDARSDLFALGALLYECIAGRPAFDGANVFEIGVQVINRDPPPPSSINPRVPAELDRITMKALRKKPGERYQSAEEMRTELQAWRTSLNGHDLIRTQRQPARATRAQSSALRNISVMLEQPRLSLRFLLLLVLVVGLAFWGILRWAQRATPTPFQRMQVTRLTNTGKSVDAAISPDGKYVVHVIDDGEQQSLWTKQIQTGNNVQIVAPSEGKVFGLTFSLDGNFVYYVRWEKNSPGTLYQVPVLGGAPRRLLASINTPISFSPDGQRIAFLRYHQSLAESALVTANADGTGEQILAMRKGAEVFSTVGPVWSPDGRVIACVTGGFKSGYHSNLVEVRVEDGVENPIISQKWFYIGGIAWLGDGSGLVVTVEEQPFSPFQIWHVAYPSGELSRVTNDLNTYLGVSVTTDSSALVTVQADRRSNIWIAPDGDARRATQITSGADQQFGLSWTPDGRIVYASVASGNQDIWIMNADGTNQKQLTFDSHIDREASVSPDGRYIVFASNRAGSFNVWRMDIDGNNPLQLTKGSDDQFPQFSPDGQWTIYQGVISGVPVLWKIPAHGGESVRLTDKFSNWPVVSPDGKLIACTYREEPNSPWKVALIPFAGGPPVKLFDIPMLSLPLLFWQRVHWSRDGRALNYIEDRGGVSNIWNQPVDGGGPRQLTDFKSDRILNFDWSYDGKQLACIRGPMTSDVIILTTIK